MIIIERGFEVKILKKVSVTFCTYNLIINRFASFKSNTFYVILVLVLIAYVKTLLMFKL